jgi:hypothetical protein
MVIYSDFFHEKWWFSIYSYVSLPEDTAFFCEVSTFIDAQKKITLLCLIPAARRMSWQKGI